MEDIENSTPQISVIMGVYNVKNSNMAEAAIKSILNQSFTDFEFIICDDGSLNDTWNILKKWKDIDYRIILIRNKRNRGLAYSLNHCLKYARGKYITRMDIDDIASALRFEKEYQYLEKHRDYALVSCCAELFDEKGTWGYRKYKEYPKKKDFLFGNPILHPGIMIRKETLLKLGGYTVSKETLRTEDYELFMRLYSADYKAYVIQEALYKFREDEEAYRRKKYKYRIDEAKVRYRGFKLLGLMPKGYLYILKPLIIGLIPQKIILFLRKERKMKNNNQ